MILIIIFVNAIIKPMNTGNRYSFKADFYITYIITNEV